LHATRLKHHGKPVNMLCKLVCSYTAPHNSRRVTAGGTSKRDYAPFLASLASLLEAALGLSAGERVPLPNLLQRLESLKELELPGELLCTYTCRFCLSFAKHVCLSEDLLPTHCSETQP
jgi:hypothetical protein